MLGLIWGFIARQSLAVWAYAGIAIAVAAVLFGVRNAGKQAERVANMKATLKAIEVKNEINDTIDRANDADLERLRERWTRPD